MGAALCNITRKTLLVLSCILLAIGNCGVPLIMRLYFVNGGNRMWLATWLETGGFPILIIPLIISYFNRRRIEGANAKLTLIKLPTFISATIIGLIVGLTNYMFAFGVGHLPVSTSTLIGSTQLAFTAFFAFLIVKQKFTPYLINAIVLLTLGAAVLALHASSDKSDGKNNKMYILGFLSALAASALSGLFFPLTELVFKKAKQAISYTLVMEVQLVLAFVSTAMATIGMLVNNDFEAIPHEAKVFQLGEAKYCVVLVASALVSQTALLGVMGVIFTTSSLVNGVIVTVLLPITEILGVIFFGEKFGAEKGVALVLSLWGFTSHFYGEFRHAKKRTQVEQTNIPISGGPCCNCHCWLA